MVLSGLLSSGTSSSSLVDQVEFLILLLIVTLIVALLSRRLRVPYTLLLVIVGFVVGLFPFLPNEHIDPNLVFYVFIPALLFEGAWNAEIDQLEADLLPIVLLAIPGLVLWLPGIFFGLLGAVIGQVLMIYAFMPLLDVLARWWARRTGERRSRLPR